MQWNESNNLIIVYNTDYYHLLFTVTKFGWVYNETGSNNVFIYFFIVILKVYTHFKSFVFIKYCYFMYVEKLLLFKISQSLLLSIFGFFIYILKKADPIATYSVK